MSAFPPGHSFGSQHGVDAPAASGLPGIFRFGLSEAETSIGAAASCSKGDFAAGGPSPSIFVFGQQIGGAPWGQEPAPEPAPSPIGQWPAPSPLFGPGPGAASAPGRAPCAAGLGGVTYTGVPTAAGAGGVENAGTRSGQEGGSGYGAGASASEGMFVFGQSTAPPASGAEPGIFGFGSDAAPASASRPRLGRQRHGRPGNKRSPQVAPAASQTACGSSRGIFGDLPGSTRDGHSGEQEDARGPIGLNGRFGEQHANGGLFSSLAASGFASGGLGAGGVAEKGATAAKFPFAPGAFGNPYDVGNACGAGPGIGGSLFGAGGACGATTGAGGGLLGAGSACVGPSGAPPPFSAAGAESADPAGLAQARRLASDGRFPEAANALVPGLSGPQGALDLLGQILASWATAHQTDRGQLRTQDSAHLSLTSQLQVSRESVQRLKEDRARLERDLLKQRQDAKADAANMRLRICALEDDVENLREQLADERRTRRTTPPAWTREDMVRRLAELECVPLRYCDRQGRPALRKRIFLKWHPDKQPSPDHASLATAVMQELQNQPEWSM
mmetsp:Transcript_83431/g.232693  ORF Transcript_83431/g.232693 Transcript_83431/m.232693 type:complete len:560 (+) Transcript_83431:67-1746(+)